VASDRSILQIPGSEIQGAIQLRNAYLYEIKVAREATDRRDASEPPLLDPKIRGWSFNEERTTFVVVLGAVIHHQFRPEAAVDVDISVAGHFDSQTPIDEETARSFANVNALLLLWPYLRGYVGSIASATQLDLPTLPVIDIAALLQRVSDLSHDADGASLTDDPVVSQAQ
jgi:preprotein translocase subunit SecB